MLSIFEKPNCLLRLEGLAVFILALAGYSHFSFGWGLFWSTLLLPDLALLGYLINARIGALTYNITHAKILPCALALAALALADDLLLSLALIWFVHIGLDRMFGYGLKYPEGFKITHLGVIGQASNLKLGRYLPCTK
ncbi:DUF4260 family protein [Methylomonas paludis]|uniref:DUF4260 family protein n=1 Tax=Methylomonas paludis TaxID=1173101 RepID=A0A975MPC8_9GAMM|nr:DUF4260 family protein [Methylomonas paludis]QWF71573.1 DUF4260 family protein [Methylomonas paludis]